MREIPLDRRVGLEFNIVAIYILFLYVSSAPTENLIFSVIPYL